MWLEEADVLDKNVELVPILTSSFGYYLYPPHALSDYSLEWTRMKISSPNYYFERITTLCLASEVFLAIGNTGSAVHRRWVADEIFVYLHDSLKTPQTLKLTPLLGSDILVLRHPDPKTSPALTVNNPTLQIWGSWQKLSIHKAAALGSRGRSAICAFDGSSISFSVARSLVFKSLGYLYVLGGEKTTGGPHYRDFWMLDLAKLDGWRQLPDFPLPKTVTDDLVGYKMAPHRDGRLFVFTGMSTLIVFDTKRRKWTLMQTTFIPDAESPDWPYPSARLTEYSAHCVGDRFYVFGGLHHGSVIGTDLLLELNISSRKWRRLSGSAVPVPSTTGPGPRGQCPSWVGKDQRRIFFMYGIANRHAAMIHKAVHGSLYSYGYGDLWSWDIKAEKWTRERVHGNAPSPRGEMSCTYVGFNSF